jgi:hypothetical protein
MTPPIDTINKTTNNHNIIIEFFAKVGILLGNLEFEIKVFVEIILSDKKCRKEFIIK